MHVFGSTFLTPQILLSSSSGSRSGTLLGLERLRRACASGERGTGKNEVEAYIVQIFDKPSQVLALQTWDSILVFVPAEEVDELFVETRRSSVEIAEFLQEIGRVHGGDGRGALRFSAYVPDVESRGGRLRRTRTGIDDLGIRRASWTWGECVAVRHLSLHLDSSRPPKVLMTTVLAIPNLTSTWNTNIKLVVNALELVHWSRIVISTNIPDYHAKLMATSASQQNGFETEP